MCRLFGLVSNRPVEIHFSLAESRASIRDLSYCNPDGWGIGWYENGKP